MTKVVLNDSYQREGENEPPRRDEQRTNHEKNADGRPSEDELKKKMERESYEIIRARVTLRVTLRVRAPLP